MFQYIIEIPYENKSLCTDIGLRLNNIDSLMMLILCLNKQRSKVLFYLECSEAWAGESYESRTKGCSSYKITSGGNFWEMVLVKEWVIYTLLEGMEHYNKLMINKILELY